MFVYTAESSLANINTLQELTPNLLYPADPNSLQGLLHSTSTRNIEFSNRQRRIGSSGNAFLQFNVPFYPTLIHIRSTFAKWSLHVTMTLKFNHSIVFYHSNLFYSPLTSQITLAVVVGILPLPLENSDGLFRIRGEFNIVGLRRGTNGLLTTPESAPGRPPQSSPRISHRPTRGRKASVASILSFLLDPE
jgi:hypothetical protein